MKKIISGSILALMVLVLAGCGEEAATTTNENGEITSPSSVYLSQDFGKTWKPQHQAGLNLPGKDILSLEINSQDDSQAFLGTMSSGIIKTDNRGESWQQLENFGAEKVYGLAVDPSNPLIIYASGVWQKRGKIYKSLDGGVTWQEIYTEAAEGPLVVSLALDKKNSNIVLAANSEGTLLKSIDGGNTWRNIFKAGSAVTQIIIAPNSANIFLLTSGNYVYRSSNGGTNFLEISEKIDSSLEDFSGILYTGNFDSQGRLYLGGETGIIRSPNNGESWERVETLSDSSVFPVRALDINPQNPQEIVYAAARAVYRSSDGGATWSSFQLDSGSIARVLKYAHSNPQIVYLGLFEL